MKKLENMLLVGATEKHAGKTTLTAKIINKIKSKNSGQKLIGIKITILREGKHSISGYNITNETKTDTTKDTARMLKAGADKVLWLRCDEFNVEAGIEKLLSEIPQDALIICESNSARNYIEPGLFLMIRKKEEGEIKKTAQKVLSYPNIEVRTEMAGEIVVYEPDIAEILEIDSGGWHLSI